MTELINVNINKTETDQDSGDVYYKLEATLMQPGAAFSEDEDEKEDIRDRFKKVFLP